VVQRRSQEPEELAARFVRDLSGYIVTQTLGVVADLGVADAVGDEAVHVEDLAVAVGADAGALYRAMRALASLGYFTETAPRAFAHTPLSQLLREGTPDSLRHFARWNAGEPFQAWATLGETIRSGSPAFDRVFGAPLFDYLSEHDDSRETFNQAMAGTAVARLEALLAQDWSDVRRLVDVGGGRGTLVAAMLSRYPAMHGVVFDLPAVVDEATQHLSECGLDGRSTVLGGDFFDEVPAGGDFYVLSQILHDWNDDEAVAILRACRAAIPQHGRLVLLEQVVPPGDEPSYAKLLDLQMLVMLTGRERTEAEWRELLAAGGFELQRVVTRVRSSLLEAVPI
jgi:O-methyltransferase domain